MGPAPAVRVAYALLPFYFFFLFEKHVMLKEKKLHRNITNFMRQHLIIFRNHINFILYYCTKNSASKYLSETHDAYKKVAS